MQSLTRILCWLSYKTTLSSRQAEILHLIFGPCNPGRMSSSSPSENFPFSDRNDDGSSDAMLLYPILDIGLAVEHSPPTSPSAYHAVCEDLQDYNRISIDDTIILLNAMGRSVDNLDAISIRKQFSILLSSTDTEHLGGAPGLRNPKSKVSSQASRLVSGGFRKNNALFVCELQSCGGSFTRKNGIINHYKSHLGITDKLCQYCRQGFTTSLSRHEKNCQRKQTNEVQDFHMNFPLNFGSS